MVEKDTETSKKVKVEKGGHIAVEFETKITHTAGKTVMIVPKTCRRIPKTAENLDERMLVRIK